MTRTGYFSLFAEISGGFSICPLNLYIFRESFCRGQSTRETAILPHCVQQHTTTRHLLAVGDCGFVVRVWCRSAASFSMSGGAAAPATNFSAIYSFNDDVE